MTRPVGKGLRVLITGGTGVIGSRLATVCLEAGDTVRVLAQENTPIEAARAAQLRADGVEVAVGSVTDAAALASATRGVDVVYHLAAAQHEANVPDQLFRDVNVTGTERVMEACVQAGVRRVVHGSTIGVYRAGPGETTTNDTPLEPDNIYGVTKLEGEHVVRRFADRISSVIIRIAETYGPGDRRLHKLFAGVQRGRFPLIGPGNNLHHLVFIDDLVAGLRSAAAAPTGSGEPCVLAGAAPVSTRMMIQVAAEALGVPVPRVHLPLGPMLLLARLMEGTLRPFGIQPPLHRRRMDFFLKSFQFSIADAQAAFGYAPAVDFPTGAAITARWYREQGLL